MNTEHIENETLHEFVLCLNAYSKGDYRYYEIVELESHDWDSVQEYDLVKWINSNSIKFSQYLEFLDFFGKYMLDNNLRHLGTFFVRVYCLLIKFGSHQKGLELTDSFWQLFLYCTKSEFIQFNPNTGKIIIGIDVPVILYIEIIPTQYQEEIKKRFNILYRENHSIPKTSASNQFERKTIAFPNVISSPTLENRIREKLADCRSGKDDWSKFENIAIEALEELFERELGKPQIQSRTANGAKRRDALFPNRKTNEFWKTIFYKYQSELVIFEFKNYKRPLGKEAVNQINEYANDQIGHFGIVWTRSKIGKGAIEAQRETLSGNNTLALFISDEVVLEMCKLKDEGKSPSKILEDLFHKAIARFHN